MKSLILFEFSLRHSESCGLLFLKRDFLTSSGYVCGSFAYQAVFAGAHLVRGRVLDELLAETSSVHQLQTYIQLSSVSFASSAGWLLRSLLGHEWGGQLVWHE